MNIILSNAVKHIGNGSYLLRKHTLRGQDCFDIESNGLTYSDCSPTHHGLQCSFNGGDENYVKIMGLCDKLVEIIKEIDKKITDQDKINWFKKINFFGTPQEKEHFNLLVK